MRDGTLGQKGENIPKRKKKHRGHARGKGRGIITMGNKVEINVQEKAKSGGRRSCARLKCTAGNPQTVPGGQNPRGTLNCRSSWGNRRKTNVRKGRKKKEQTPRGQRQKDKQLQKMEGTSREGEIAV